MVPQCEHPLEIIPKMPSPTKKLRMKVPRKFVCPISKKLMKTPVVSNEGVHFEEAAVLEWIKSGSVWCPVTKTLLDASCLKPDYELHRAIKSWRRKQPWYKEYQVVAMINFCRKMERVASCSSTRSGSCSTAMTDGHNMTLLNLGCPQEYMCPLTKEVMRDPVTTRAGVNFERRAIMEWLDMNKEECPVTGRPLRVSHLTSNHCLQMEIRRWRNRNEARRSSLHSTQGSRSSSSSLISIDHPLDMDSNYATASRLSLLSTASSPLPQTPTFSLSHTTRSSTSALTTNDTIRAADEAARAFSRLSIQSTETSITNSSSNDDDDDASLMSLKQHFHKIGVGVEIVEDAA